MESIGRRIMLARDAAGLTQAQLAERVPCNPQTVSNWEHERRQPRYDDLMRLAEVLERPVSWFLGEESAETAWAEVEEQLTRVREDLARVSTLVERRGAHWQPGPDRLVPIARRLERGARSALTRGSFGWRRLTREQGDGVSLVLVAGDAHYPLLQPGDLLGVSAAESAAPGELVTARLESGGEVLKRIALDGGLESIDPAHAPLREAYAVTGVVRWLQRDFGAAADPQAEALQRRDWVQAAETQVRELEAALERGEGQWPQLEALCERLRAEAELLAPVYGAAVQRPVAHALSRSARALGERGRYPEALTLARQAADLYQTLEQVGERSREALNNLYNVSQLALFLGELALARETALAAAGCADWTVRWKALKNLDELAVNYLAETVDGQVGQGILDLAQRHRAQDPVQAELAASVAYELRGNAAFARGDYTAARAAAAAQVAAAEAAGLPYRRANAHLDAAQYALAGGDPAGALAELALIEPLCREQDLGDLDAMRLAQRAAAHAAQGTVSAARLDWGRALRRAAELGSPRALLMASLAGAALARAEGDTAGRAEHLAAAREVAARLGMKAYEQVVDRLGSEG